jgi:hypothetical protein
LPKSVLPLIYHFPCFRINFFEVIKKLLQLIGLVTVKKLVHRFFGIKVLAEVTSNCKSSYWKSFDRGLSEFCTETGEIFM